MIQEVGRLRIVQRFSALTGTYTEIRAGLAEKAWGILQRAVRENICCVFSTFPGWTGPEGMMDYEVLWLRFPVEDVRTLCFTVQLTPIDDKIADSILQLFSESAVRAMADRAGSPRAAVPMDGLSKIGLSLHSFVGTCFRDSDMTAGLVMYGDVSAAARDLTVERHAVQTELLAHIATRSAEPLLLVTD